LLFPDGRFFPRWSRWVAVVWIILVAGLVFFPETILSWNNWPFPLYPFVSLAFFLFGMAVIVMRYRRRETAGQRERIKWIVFSLLLVGLVMLLDISLFEIYPALTDSYPLATGRQAVFWELGQDSLAYISQFILGIAIGLAVFRNQL